MGSCGYPAVSRREIPSQRWFCNLRRWGAYPALLGTLAFGQTAKPPSTTTPNKRTASAQGAKSSTKVTPEPVDTLQQHYDAARTYGLSGDQERASGEYKVFLGEALRRMANAKAHEGDPDKAIELFKEAVTIAPTNADLHVDYAVTCLDHDLLPEAKAKAEE